MGRFVLSYLLIVNIMSMIINLLDKYLLTKKLPDILLLISSSLGGAFGNYITIHFFKYKSEDKALLKRFYPIFIIWIIFIFIILI